MPHPLRPSISEQKHFLVFGVAGHGYLHVATGGSCRQTIIGCYVCSSAILASGRFSKQSRPISDPLAAGVLIDRVPDHRGEFLDQAVGHATAIRQVVVVFELRDRGTRGVVQYSGRFDWTVAVLGQSSLHPRDPRRWTDQFGNSVIAPGRNGLRRGRACDRTRRRAGYKRFERIAFCRR